MLNCEYCDYYKKVISKNQDNMKGFCEYTGFVFQKNPEDYELEDHPCYDYDVNICGKETEEFNDLEVANK